MENKIVNELNEFLEGNYMAIHAYEDFIEHMKDQDLKKVLQKLQQDHKEHATLVSERIQNLGGVPVNDVGLKGKMVEFMKNFTGTAKGTIPILKDVIAGEKRGIEVSRKILDGDLDPDSLQLVKKILSVDEQHVEIFHELLEKKSKE